MSSAPGAHASPPSSSSPPLEFRRTLRDDVPAVQAVYDAVLTALEEGVNYPDWKRGEYPTDADVERWVAAGELYIVVAEPDEPGPARVLGVTVLNHTTAEGYDAVPWRVDASGEDVVVLHTLAAVPDASRRGVGSFLVEGAVGEARARGCRAVRLDVLEGNEPACALYRRCGFVDLGVHELHYDDTDLTRFVMFERPL